MSVNQNGAPGSLDVHKTGVLLLEDPGAVVELRALEVEGERGKGVLSGYFNDVDALAAAVHELDGKAKGIFVTFNPVNTALLARANNRIKKATSTTSDADVTARAWLLVDIDPTRPSGISSTDSEKADAEAVMKNVGRHLRQFGFPAPVVGDSGNGFHLLYRLDLPADDGGLVSRCLHALAFRFDTDAATIDQSVSNPARMTKLYGTLVRKGDATADRPHRRSRLLHVPQDVAVVGRGLLENLAGEQPTTFAATGATGAFDIDQYLSEHGLDVVRTAPWSGGRKWVLATCPFDPNHTDAAAYVVQLSSGAIAAGCHHNGCTGRTWEDLRANCEPCRSNSSGASVSSVSASQEESKIRWPDPEPLPNELPPVDEFDPAFLPEAARRYVEDIAERMQCPLDFPGVSLILVFATVVGRRVGIRPKRLDDWTVVPNLWGMVIGRPSIMKSPAIKQPLGLLMELEREARDAHRKAMVEYEATRFAWQSKKKGIQHKGVSLPEAREYLDEEPEEPVRTRYVVNDTTVEKLGEIQGENPNGLLQFRDELIGFLRSLEKDNQQHARAYYLEAWDGTSSFIYDRIGRGTIDIASAIISVLGGIQPGPLASYYTQAVRGGAGDDGLLQRFQLAVWPDVNKSWANIDRLPDARARRAVLDNLRRLRDRSKELGAERDPGDESGIPFLRFAEDAQVRFDDWRTGLESQLRAGDEHPAMESHLAKFRSLIPSLALLFHLADGGTGPVPLRCLDRAIATGAYLESHARRLYSVALSPGLPAATRLLAKIKSGALSSEFTLREVYRKGWSGLGTKEDAQPAVALLEEYGWLRSQRVSTGGAPKETLIVNPRVLDRPSGGTDTTDRGSFVGSVGTESEVTGATSGTDPTRPENAVKAGPVNPLSNGTDRTDKSPSVGSVSGAEADTPEPRHDEPEPATDTGLDERGLGWAS